MVQPKTQFDTFYTQLTKTSGNVLLHEKKDGLEVKKAWWGKLLVWVQKKFTTTPTSSWELSSTLKTLENLVQDAVLNDFHNVEALTEQELQNKINEWKEKLNTIEKKLSKNVLKYNSKKNEHLTLNLVGLLKTHFKQSHNLLAEYFVGHSETQVNGLVKTQFADITANYKKLAQKLKEQSPDSTIETLKQRIDTAIELPQDQKIERVIAVVSQKIEDIQKDLSEHLLRKKIASLKEELGELKEYTNLDPEQKISLLLEKLNTLDTPSSLELEERYNRLNELLEQTTQLIEQQLTTLIEKSIDSHVGTVEITTIFREYEQKKSSLAHNMTSLAKEVACFENRLTKGVYSVHDATNRIEHSLKEFFTTTTTNYHTALKTEKVHLLEEKANAIAQEKERLRKFTESDYRNLTQSSSVIDQKLKKITDLERQLFSLNSQFDKEIIVGYQHILTEKLKTIPPYLTISTQAVDLESVQAAQQQTITKELEAITNESNRIEILAHNWNLIKEYFVDTTTVKSLSLQIEAKRAQVKEYSTNKGVKKSIIKKRDSILELGNDVLSKFISSVGKGFTAIQEKEFTSEELKTINALVNTLKNALTKHLSEDSKRSQKTLIIALANFLVATRQHSEAEKLYSAINNKTLYSQYILTDNIKEHLTAITSIAKKNNVKETVIEGIRTFAYSLHEYSWELGEEKHTQTLIEQNLAKLLLLVDKNPAVLSQITFSHLPVAKAQIDHLFGQEMLKIKDCIDQLWEKSARMPIGAPKLLEVQYPFIIADLLLTSEGEINHALIPLIKKELLSSKKERPMFEQVLTNSLNQLAFSKKAQYALRSLKAPPSSNETGIFIVRTSLGKKIDDPITDRDTRLAALAASFTHWRQGNVGSCFVSCYAIHKSKNILWKVFSDFNEIFEKGACIRIVNNKKTAFTSPLHPENEYLDKPIDTKENGSLISVIYPHRIMPLQKAEATDVFVHESIGMQRACHELGVDDVQTACNDAIRELHNQKEESITPRKILKKIAENQHPNSKKRDALFEKAYFAFEAASQQPLLRFWENTLAGMARAPGVSWIHTSSLNNLTQSIVAGLQAIQGTTASDQDIQILMQSFPEGKLRYFFDPSITTTGTSGIKGGFVLYMETEPGVFLPLGTETAFIDGVRQLLAESIGRIGDQATKERCTQLFEELNNNSAPFLDKLFKTYTKSTRTISDAPILETVPWREIIGGELDPILQVEWQRPVEKEVLKKDLTPQEKLQDILLFGMPYAKEYTSANYAIPIWDQKHAFLFIPGHPSFPKNCTTEQECRTYATQFIEKGKEVGNRVASDTVQSNARFYINELFIKKMPPTALLDKSLKNKQTQTQSLDGYVKTLYEIVTEDLKIPEAAATNMLRTITEAITEVLSSPNQYRELFDFYIDPKNNDAFEAVTKDLPGTTKTEKLSRLAIKITGMEVPEDKIESFINKMGGDYNKTIKQLQEGILTSQWDTKVQKIQDSIPPPTQSADPKVSLAEAAAACIKAFTEGLNLSADEIQAQTKEIKKAVKEAVASTCINKTFLEHQFTQLLQEELSQNTQPTISQYLKATTHAMAKLRGSDLNQNELNNFDAGMMTHGLLKDEKKELFASTIHFADLNWAITGRLQSSSGERLAIEDQHLCFMTNPRTQELIITRMATDESYLEVKEDNALDISFVKPGSELDLGYEEEAKIIQERKVEIKSTKKFTQKINSTLNTLSLLKKAPAALRRARKSAQNMVLALESQSKGQELVEAISVNFTNHLETLRKLIVEAKVQSSPDIKKFTHMLDQAKKEFTISPGETKNLQEWVKRKEEFLKNQENEVQTLLANTTHTAQEECQETVRSIIEEMESQTSNTVENAEFISLLQSEETDLLSTLFKEYS